jgi:hypothetical protein
MAASPSDPLIRTPPLKATGAAVRIAMPHVSACAVAACRYSRAQGLIHTIARKRRRARIVSGANAALLIHFANRSALGDIS